MSFGARAARLSVIAALGVVLACNAGATGATRAGDSPPTGEDGASDAGEAEGEEPLDAAEAAAKRRAELEAFAARFDREPAPASPPPAAADAGECPPWSKRDRALGILFSPEKPGVGQEVKILAATLGSEEPLALRVDYDGSAQTVTETIHRSGVPAATIARYTPQEPGKHVIVIGRERQGLRCRAITVFHRPLSRDPEVELAAFHAGGAGGAGGTGGAGGSEMSGDADLGGVGSGSTDAGSGANAASATPGVWPVVRSWSGSEEALYSAWVRELFQGPAGEDLAWKALSEVTSDPSRNLLHDYYGLKEDHPRDGFNLVPDCADTPYFLRAYYSWKRELPFGFRTCTRGRGKPPVCHGLRTNIDPPDLRERWTTGESVPTHVARVELIEFFFRRTLGWGVHTGNGRTAFGDSISDLYPVELDRRALRPGMVYADPYGHILVLAGLVAPQGSRPGILFAVDGQPDGSITRKRFWEGNFLWNQDDPSLGGSGFKAFRPLFEVGDQKPTGLMPADDETLGRLRAYDDLSTMQSKLSQPEFYDLMDGLITPGERSPFRAQEELVAALAEATRVRVTSVNNGLQWHEENPGEIVEMPTGHSIFETTGAWENYSTPARDLRLLIAMDVVLGFGDKVQRRPEAFGLAEDPALLAETLERLDEHRALLFAEHEITYERADGSSWKLGLDEIVARAEHFEVAYNPNDCPEVRWGAPQGSEEAGTCDRRADKVQAAMMREYRVWFVQRRRPTRGDHGPEVPELIEYLREQEELSAG